MIIAGLSLCGAGGVCRSLLSWPTLGMRHGCVLQLVSVRGLIGNPALPAVQEQSCVSGVYTHGCFRQVWNGPVRRWGYADGCFRQRCHGGCRWDSLQWLLPAGVLRWVRQWGFTQWLPLGQRHGGRLGFTPDCRSRAGATVGVGRYTDSCFGQVPGRRIGRVNANGLLQAGAHGRCVGRVHAPRLLGQGATVGASVGFT